MVTPGTLRLVIAPVTVISLLASGVSAAGAADTRQVGTVPGLPAAAVEVMNASPYANGIWAISVTDAFSGAPLVDYNSQFLVEPGSVMKTVSAAGAWLEFGPDSRIVTPVVRDGRVVAGTLQGDLVLIAKGDVTMGGQTAPDGSVIFANFDHNDANAIPGATLADNDPMAGLDRLARQVRASGITRVAGQVVIDDRLFVTEDLGSDGPVSPIVINHNLIDLLVTPTRPGRPATIQTRALVAPWTVDNRVRTVAAGRASGVVVTAQGTTIRVTGTIAAGDDPILRVWHVADPATFARTAFIEALGRVGVVVDADPTEPNPAGILPSRGATDDLPRVARLRGLPLREQLTYILKVSYNRGAQTLICLLAVSAGSRQCDDGYPVLARQLRTIGVDTRGIVQVDGSGLPGNYLTPDAVTDLMTAFAKRPDWAQWREAMPIMGVDGSVASVQQDSPAAGHVFAKTGTLGAGDLLNDRFRLGTKALGGYIQASSGRWLSIAITVNQSMFDDLQGVFAANEDIGKIATALWQAY